MSIQLFIEPNTPPMQWKTFCKKKEPFSVALDGYVRGGPHFLGSSGPFANYNHHEECVRIATRATCSQVLLAIRRGFFQMFRDEQGPRVNIFVNDCDQDVCLSVFLLHHGYLSEHTINPLLNRLVDLEDKLDTTAGAYPYPADLPVLKELAWVFEPYTQFRLSGGLEQRSADAFRSVIVDVGNRIMKHIVGMGDALLLDTRYEIIEKTPLFALVKEIGAQARTGMFADGIKAFVSTRQRSDGRYVYIIGRLSEFIPVDLLALIPILNEAEGCSDDQWGGADNVIGSPRAQASSLEPKDILRIIHSFTRI